MRMCTGAGVAGALKIAAETFDLRLPTWQKSAKVLTSPTFPDSSSSSA